MAKIKYRRTVPPARKKVEINPPSLVDSMSGAQIAREIHEEFLRRLTGSEEMSLDTVRQLRKLLESGEPVTEQKVMDLIKERSGGAAVIDKN